MNHKSSFIFYFFFLLVINFIKAEYPSIQLEIVNESIFPIDLFWVDVNTREDNSPIKYKQQNQNLIPTLSSTTIGSYPGHEFYITPRDLNNKDESINPHLFFTSDPSTLILPAPLKILKGYVKESYRISYNSYTNQLEAKLESETIKIYEKIIENINSKDCYNLYKLDKEKLNECILDTLEENKIEKVYSNKNILTYSRNLMVNSLRNYTCNDETLETTKPIMKYDVQFDNKNYEINLLLDEDRSKIWLIDNFVTDEECEVLMETARPNLMRATVASNNGTAVISNNRRAQQAVYNNHQYYFDKDPLWNLQQRILGITNLHSGFNLSYIGQEPFTVIQYNKEDEYSPHCDSNCSGQQHVRTARVATAVLYCGVPAKGGATYFTKTDILVRPVKGSATFFTYKGIQHDPNSFNSEEVLTSNSKKNDKFKSISHYFDSSIMDDGYTEHSGCPVLEGEKWITTFWMRHGVDSNEFSYRKFDPSGFELSLNY